MSMKDFFFFGFSVARLLLFLFLWNLDDQFALFIFFFSFFCAVPSFSEKISNFLAVSVPRYISFNFLAVSVQRYIYRLVRHSSVPICFV